MNNWGPVRKTIREALMQAFDYDELNLAMGDIDIEMERIAPRTLSWEMAVNELIDACWRTEDIRRMLDGAIDRNRKNTALRVALADFVAFQASPNVQSSPGAAGSAAWTPRGVAGPASNQPVGPRDTIPTDWRPSSPQSEPTDPPDLPAGLPRSEWDVVWAEVWQEQWPVMLDDMKVRLWRRVARRRAAGTGPTQGPASQALQRAPGSPIHFQGDAAPRSEPMPREAGQTQDGNREHGDQERRDD